VAHYRRKGRGWQAIVTLPGGGQRTKSGPLKGPLVEWAKATEGEISKGEWYDPKPASKLTLSQWHETWVSGRIVSTNTKLKNASHWRTHVEKAFGSKPLAAITRDDVRTWVAQMHAEGTGAQTILAARQLLAKILADAVEDGLIKTNPALRVKTPTTNQKVPFFWTYDEARAIQAQLDPPWDLFVELDFYLGLRMGEMRGLRCEQINLERRLIHVTRVETRQGPQEYPKGKQQRSVPIPGPLVERLREMVQGRDPMSYVFTGEGRRPIDDRNFAKRIFAPAVESAGARRGTPHDMRHTAASWLVMQGVDLYRVQALLGHADAKTTSRYAHLAPDAFDRLHVAWGLMQGPGQAPALAQAQS
jgi:integrase